MSQAQRPTTPRSAAAAASGAKRKRPAQVPEVPSRTGRINPVTGARTLSGTPRSGGCTWPHFQQLSLITFTAARPEAASSQLVTPPPNSGSRPAPSPPPTLNMRSSSGYRAYTHQGWIKDPKMPPTSSSSRANEFRGEGWMVSRLVKAIYPVPQQDVSKFIQHCFNMFNMSQFVPADKRLTAKAWMDTVNEMLMNWCTQSNFLVRIAK